MPQIFLRGGLAVATNRDSWCMMAIITEMGVSHRARDFLASLYQPDFSRKISQTLLTSLGGDVAQADMKSGIHNRKENLSKLRFVIFPTFNSSNEFELVDHGDVQ